MIRSLKHRGLKRLYEKNDRSGIRPDLLDAAPPPPALDIPRHRLHRLKGDGSALDVELIDYH